MAYPYRYVPQFDFAAAKARGEAVDGQRLQSALANIAESINQIRSFIAAGFNADKTWQPLEYTARELEEQLEFTATASQTEFEFPSGTVADTTTDQVRVYSGGALIAPSNVTLATDKVTIPAQTAGAAGEVLYANPLTHVLILTAIVVGVATLAVGLALVVRIREAYGTIEDDEISEADYSLELEKGV